MIGGDAGRAWRARSRRASPANPTSQYPGRVQSWVLAVRPRTLTIAVGPVLVGTAAASADTGRFDPAIMAVALLAAVLIQTGTNLQNDVGDFLRGADGADRIGPPRVTSLGWLSAAQVERAAALAFGLAIALGGYLVAVGGWPVLVAGVVSIAAGIAYTRGPRPIAYTALGEFFVFVFFGLVAVGGSYYLQAGSLTPSAIGAGAMIGLLAAAVLAVNNYRDIESDRRAGKHTLAARMGGGFARAEYAVLLLAPFALLAALVPLADIGAAAAMPLIGLPWAARLAWTIHRRPPGAWLNGLLAETALLGLAFAGLLAVSFGLQRAL
jgi:1,4-dihydroxy-2-naphthoate polyprenyltransferase